MLWLNKIKLHRRGANFLIKKLSASLPVWQPVETRTVLPALSQGQYKMPVNWGSVAVHTILFKAFSYYNDTPVVLPARYLYSLKNANVTWEGVAFNNLNIFLPSLVYPGLAPHYNGSFLLKQWIGKHLFLPKQEVFALVYNQWASYNYFHWVIETLPRLVVLSQQFPNATVLLPYLATDYMRTTVAIFGFNKTVTIPKDATAKVPQLAVVENTGNYWHQDPDMMQQIAHKVVTQMAPAPVIPHRLIYASRSRANSRKIINEAVLITALTKHHFETVYFEDMSFTEQVQLMRTVKVIIGLHGANLTNALFMQAGTTVIELMNTEHENLVYFRLASYMALQYYCLPCTPQQGAAAANYADVTVDVAQVEEIIQSFLNC